MDFGTIFIIIWVIAVIYTLGAFYIRGKKALSIFPDLKGVKVQYRDQSASGYSTKSWITKRGGANKVLDVIITENELWIKNYLIFAGISKQYDLIHKIPLSNIVELKNVQNRTTIDFRSESGENKQVVLKIKDSEVFSRIIKNTLC